MCFFQLIVAAIALGIEIPMRIFVQSFAFPGKFKEISTRNIKIELKHLLIIYPNI